ncbi:MAG: methionyl-tRNA formyltransferase [Bacteroidota bacterium]|jgi:methionyl-tRNA formyltransferase
MKIGVLCSGNLGMKVLEQLFNEFSIAFVLTDSKSEGILAFCYKHALPVFKGNPRNGNSRSFLHGKECEVLLSVNYLFLVDQDLIDFPKKYAINIHGSLLPKYRGRTPHVWAIINNEKKTGITAHLIDIECDAGALIEQVEVEIEQSDTGASILQKYEILYWPLIQKTLRKIQEKDLITTPQNHTKATYFGKRTPDDGKIDWSWQKERIFNWVRAQAHPYPGAFTYLNGEKLIIDSISFTDDGFNDEIPNGQIMSFHPLKVKTPNGVIKIEKYRGELEINQQTKIVLG